MNEIIVSCTHINKTFTEGNEKISPLIDINLTTHESELVLLMGPSGCGKTTLISIIGGILKQDKGEIEVAYNVLYSLCNLYEKRTSEYIEMYGYDTWEKMFRFHNYDYDWVDKLDEEYELEMDKLFDEEDDYVSEQDEFY